MIENRFRLEKQVFLGRQVVRRSLQARSRGISPARSDSRATSPRPEISRNPPSYRTAALLVPTGSEPPLSVDTDAEEAFKEKLFKRERGSPASNSASLTPRANGTNPPSPRARNLTRRRWATPIDDDSQEFPTLAAERSATTSVPEQSPPSTSSNGFFLRLRTQSFPSFKNPFLPLKSVDAAAEEAWSSESSSEGDLIDPVDIVDPPQV
jgi:hypothetical protein